MLTGDQIRERIKKALHHGGTHSYEDLVKQLRNGSAKLFHNDHGACVVEIMESPLMRWAHVWIVAGELPGVMDLQDQVIEYARSENCHHLTTTARLGWTKVLPEYGWKVKAVDMVHAL